MHRLGFAVLLVAATLACDKSQPPPQNPEPTSDAPPPQPDPEPESEEPEPEPEPEPAAEPEVMAFDADSFSEGGFEARHLHCKFDDASSTYTGYIKASLVDADAALDACAPKGAAIEVTWRYMGGPLDNISVSAENQKVANCIGAAMKNNVSAGVRAACSGWFLIGDSAGATTNFEKRTK